MTSEDVILIIDEICGKCGIAVSSIDEAISTFASYEITGFLTDVIIVIIASLAVGIPLCFLYKKEKAKYDKIYEESKKDKYWHPLNGRFSVFDDGSGILAFLFVFFIICLLIGGVILIFYVPALIQWMVSPEAAFIIYVLDYI